MSYTVCVGGMYAIYNKVREFVIISRLPKINDACGSMMSVAGGNNTCLGLHALFSVNYKFLFEGKIESDFDFHGRVVFLGENVPVVVKGGVVSVYLDRGLWDRNNTRQVAVREGLAIKSTDIMAKSSASCTWCKGLEEIAQLYLSEDIIFIEVYFSVLGETAFENNFAALVPLKLVQGDVCVLRPFNGNTWEKQTTPNVPLAIMPLTQKYKTVSEVPVVWDMFDKRIIMFYGMRVLAPFNKIPRDDKVMTKKMYTNQDVFSYHFGYAIHSNIGWTHMWIKRHFLPRVFVRNVFHRAFFRIGGEPLQSGSDSRDRFTKDLILQVIAYCIHETDLGLKSYRRDLCGEDIRTRSIQRSMTKESPLLPGGDCEDQAQTFAQMIYSADAMKDWLVSEMPEYAGILRHVFPMRYVCE